MVVTDANLSPTCVEIKIYGALVLTRRVDTLVDFHTEPDVVVLPSCKWC